MVQDGNRMHIHDLFLELTIILLSARLLGEVFSYFKAPPVIGELLTGVILGPSILNWIELTPIIKLLAEIGVVLLLFEVGLDTDLTKLIGTGIKPFLAAFGGVIAPFLLGFFLGKFLFGFSFLVSLFIGGTLTATSIGITVRVMTDLKRQHSHESHIVLGAAVIDDMIGVVLLALLYEFAAEGGVDLFNAGKVLLFISIFLVFAPIAAKLISITIRRYEKISEIPGLVPTTIMSLILLFAWFAYQVGAPALMGGVAVGLALSRQFFLSFSHLSRTEEAFTHKVETQIRPIVHLLTPIFFVSVGLSLNLAEIHWESGFIWLLSALLLLAAIIGKLACGFVLFTESKFIQWAVGLAMIPRGEVGLIFADMGKTSGILDQELYASMIIVIALTTLVTPFVLRWFYGRFSLPSNEGSTRNQAHF